ncbi:hypothetical protein TorRG33x02_000620, partial [Trema orientale]
SILARIMCYEVICSVCKKSSWDGCGWHVALVYNSIKKGEHCFCKAWPGIKSISGGPEPPSPGSIKPTGDGSLFSSICTIL